MARRARSCSQKCYYSHSTGKRRLSEESQSLSHVKGVEGLRNAVSKMLIDRLAEGGVDAEAVAPQLLGHCLPNEANNEFWGALLHTPLRVSDHMLSQALGLRLANNEKKSEKNMQQVVLYVRSFPLTAKQLGHVIAQFHESGLDYAKTKAWSQCLESMRDEKIAYVRYVGRTSRGALKRHREDLLVRKSGFLSKFLACLERMCLTVIDSAAIYVFPSLQLKDSEKERQFNEIREQAAIALLGLPSLLNQALTGAAKWYFTPSKLHHRGFQDLRTDTISRLEPTLFCRIREPRLIVAWANGIQHYATEHRLSVSLYRNKYHDFPDSLKNMILEQAIPSAFCGKFVLLLTVGAGISRGSYRETQAFYTGSSDSAGLIKIFLSRLWNWENSPVWQDIKSRI